MREYLIGWRKKLAAVIGVAAALLLTAIGLASYRNTIQPAGVIIHHSAIPPQAKGPAIDADYIDAAHQRRGFSAFYWGKFYHIGYHYLILPNGELQTGRPERCAGAHASGYNSYIGVCLVGNFSPQANPHGESGLQYPSDAQIKTLRVLVNRLREKYEIPSQQILKHHEVNPETECPGGNFPDFILP
jgi:N-acetyl-anhydromuramyl-L-alanine amidase AmpD